jgi:hypothetical protein
MWEPAAQNKITRWIQIHSDWPDAPSCSLALAPIPAHSITLPMRLWGSQVQSWRLHRQRRR